MRSETRWLLLATCAFVLGFASGCSGSESSATTASAGAAGHDSGRAGRGGLPLVGDACVPPSEMSPTYSGANLAEVALEFSDACASGLCLVNHFQGRVSCPYGQNQSDIDSLPPNDPTRCRLPGTSGASAADAVTVPVAPTFTGRTADDAVYCSCRCAGPDPAAEYCTCPDGFACVDLVPESGQTDPSYAGSYCVIAGTEYDPTQSYGAPCLASDPASESVCGAGNP